VTKDPKKMKETASEGLKKMGKDPSKILPPDKKEDSQVPPEGSSPDQKTAEDKKKEEERLAAEEQKNKAAEEKRLLDTPVETLSEEDKKSRKDLIELKKTEREAKREAKLQKRFDDLTGKIKELESDRGNNAKRVSELTEEIQNLRKQQKDASGEAQAEAKRIEKERIERHQKEDQDRPREERREMTRDELEEWLVEDIVSANEWIARRELRRNDERRSDSEKARPPKPDERADQKVREILKAQTESRVRVEEKHPELLEGQKLIDKLRAEGKPNGEIQKIIFEQFPKLKIVTEIVSEDPDKYLLPSNGPELIAEEMERRLNGAQKPPEKPVQRKEETPDEDETERIKREAAEAERQRQDSVDIGIVSNRGNNVVISEFEKDPLYSRHLKIWKNLFPHETEAQVKARLNNRLKERQKLGV